MEAFKGAGAGLYCKFMEGPEIPRRHFQHMELQHMDRKASVKVVDRVSKPLYNNY